MRPVYTRRRFHDTLRQRITSGCAIIGIFAINDVKAFLTYLAVERKVAASTQNQAFNALLFFFRYVLGQEFGVMEGGVRAKRKPYIPTVLSREEIKAGEYRRYHLHKTHVQKAITQAADKARICKRASAHIFRPFDFAQDRLCFASHLLQANYDIRTIQELLGHSDVKITMIYTYTVKSTTTKEAKSPLDL